MSHPTLKSLVCVIDTLVTFMTSFLTVTSESLLVQSHLLLTELESSACITSVLVTCFHLFPFTCHLQLCSHIAGVTFSVFVISRSSIIF